jgi:hypothetical protein
MLTAFLYVIALPLSVATCKIFPTKDTHCNAIKNAP